MQPEVIEQDNTSEILGSHQTTFHVAIEKEALTAVPSGDSCFLWSIVTDPMEIDSVDEVSGEVESADGERIDEPESSKDEGDNGGGPDGIDNVEEIGRALDNAEAHQLLSLYPNITLPGPGPLKGYECTKFNSTLINYNSPGNVYILPTQPDALAALVDLKQILHPKCNTGRGYVGLEIELWHCTQLEGMFSMLNMFTNPQSHTCNQWGTSVLQTVVRMG